MLLGSQQPFTTHAKLEYNRGLVNVFTGQKATPEQTKDMLTFHQIGDQSFQHYVKHRILQQPSTDDAPLW